MIDAGIKCGVVDGDSIINCKHQFDEIVWARKAAGMRGRDGVRLTIHQEIFLGKQSWVQITTGPARIVRTGPVIDLYLGRYVFSFHLSAGTTFQGRIRR